MILLYKLSTIKFFINYIFILHQFDIINFYIFLYNFSQTWNYFNSLRFLGCLIIWNGESRWVYFRGKNIWIGFNIWWGKCLVAHLRYLFLLRGNENFPKSNGSKIWWVKTGLWDWDANPYPDSWGDENPFPFSSERKSKFSLLYYNGPMGLVKRHSWGLIGSRTFAGPNNVAQP